ncbi:MAG: 50S ribosomal protein L21 [Candidatus Marinimicrobia bacterium]|nr:50S ribosomal protein L21 [Candidatus Neomarinimicrobiota bacterium]
MEVYAVVESGGKQYRVTEGQELDLELLDADPGATVALERVLAISDGTQLTVGQPLVAGAQVTAELVKQLRGPKLINFKRTKRKGYRRKMGHRQELSRVRITAIQAG